MTLHWLRMLHRWLGLLIAVPVVVQGLTGAILALEPLLPQMTTARPGPEHSSSEIIAAAQTFAGRDLRAARYTPAEKPGQLARVQMIGNDSASRVLAVDPTSLSVSIDRGAALWGWLRALHVSLLAADFGGRTIGGWCGIGLLLLLGSGVPIWWPRNGRWGTAVTFSMSANGFVFHRRMHGAVGAWCMTLLFVLTATGVVLAFPRTSRGLLGLDSGGPPRAGQVAQAFSTPLDVDAAIELARQAAPRARVRTVILPRNSREAVRVFMVHADGEGATGSILIQADAYTKTVIDVTDARRTSGGDRIYRWIHDLHEGMGLGPIWRMLTVLGGLSLPVFAVTGTTMWWLRHRSPRQVIPMRASTDDAVAD